MARMKDPVCGMTIVEDTAQQSDECRVTVRAVEAAEQYLTHLTGGLEVFAA